LGLIQSCKKNDGTEIANNAKAASQAISKLLAALKGGVIALRECDEASKSVLESAKALSAAKVNHDPNRSYAEAQRELTQLARDTAGGISKVVTTAKQNPTELGQASKQVYFYYIIEP
jgi:prefoldin subunit 5